MSTAATVKPRDSGEIGGGRSAAEVGASTPLAPNPLGAVASASTNAGGPESGRKGGPGVGAAAAITAEGGWSADRVRLPAAPWRSPRDTVTVAADGGEDDGGGEEAGRAAGEAAGDATRAVDDGDGRGVRGRSGRAVGGAADVEGRGSAGSGMDDGSGRGTSVGSGRGRPDGSGRGTADGSGRTISRGDSTTRGTNASTMLSEAGFDEAGFDEAGFDGAGFGEAGFDEAGFDGAGTCAGRGPVGDGSGVGSWAWAWAWAGSAPSAAAPSAAAPSATAGRLCVRRIGRGPRDVVSPVPFGPVLRSGVADRAVAPRLPPFVSCAGSCPRQTRTTPPVDG
ncbi:hypothetical protein GA0070612_3593 [Micromonospora chokoriensis]|uniref:Uncharacterized protein n=1 Tax=Micromonospora chokoriensis TaxID=356851 RepID=A0A1C4XH73_9ACTN|nr:hypothetical protein GA0070612_3593 [Micromonospora chokoriensis]